MMTAALLRAMPASMAAAASVLDFCSGSGTLAAAVRLRAPAANVTLLDADAVALAAARDNLGGGALCGLPFSSQLHPVCPLKPLKLSHVIP